MATAITRRELEKLYSTYGSQQRAADAIQKSQNFVWYWMRELNIPIVSHRKIPPDELRQIVYFTDIRVAQISEMYGTSRENVSKQISRLMRREPIIPYEDWLQLPHQERIMPHAIRQISRIPDITAHAAYLQILRHRKRHIKEL